MFEFKRELPKKNDTKVVIGIVRRVVVDIETVRIEVADVDAVTVGIGNCLLSSIGTENRGLLFGFNRIYILSFLYFIWEQSAKIIRHLH